MKKVNLLNKSQMKDILGGSAPLGNCTAKCSETTSVSCAGTTCIVEDYYYCAAVSDGVLSITTCAGSATPGG